MTNANATVTKREFSRSVPLKDLAPRCLFPADVELLREFEVAKRRVKALDDLLKPPIQATIDKYGTGTLVLGGREIVLASSIRESVSWKQVCEAVAPAEVIEAAKGEFTTRFEIVSAEVA